MEKLLLEEIGNAKKERKRKSSKNSDSTNYVSFIRFQFFLWSSIKQHTEVFKGNRNIKCKQCLWQMQRTNNIVKLLRKKNDDWI